MLLHRIRSVAAAGAVALALVGVATAAGARGSYADTPGDNVVALDISSVSLSESAEGPLTVSVAIANAQTLPQGGRIDLWFDLDSDQRTGDEGDEALARYLWNGTLTFSRWNGSDLVRRPAAGVTAAYAAGTLTYTVPKSALDNDSTFGVLVVTRGLLEADDDIFAFDALPELGRVAYAAPGPATFPDRVGDVPAAPDVTSVVVSDAKDGTVRFAVTTPSHATLPPDATVTLAIDRDLLGESNPMERADVLLSYADGELELLRYDEQEEDWIEEERLRARAGSLGNGVLVFEVHRSELDDVARFGLNVLSSSVDEDGDATAYDVAPDRSAWRYVLAHRPPLRLIAGGVEGEPQRPLAGRPFTISLPVRRSDTSRGLTTGTVVCSVQAGGRTINASGSIRKGLAACTVRVPRNAVAVRGSMVVRSAGKSVTAWFAGAIDFGGGVDG
jgi:hypothetical protein